MPYASSKFSTLTQLWFLIGLLSAIVDQSFARPDRAERRSTKYPSSASAQLNYQTFRATITFGQVDDKTHAPPTKQPGFEITYSGVPAGEEYKYHIHENAITVINQCAPANGHWNPYGAPATCDRNRPGHCEAGDLSAKYGLLQSDTEGQTFSSPDPRLRIGYSKLGLLGRSVVIHNKNGDRIACANIVAHP